MKEEEKKLYEGHRQRLKERFLKDFGTSMSEYEVLELMLTYALPRRDEKTRAKLLIQKFGSLPEVLSASTKRLSEYGLSEHLIAFLKTYVTVSNLMHWRALKETHEQIIKNFDDMLDYCKNRVAGLDTEEFRAIFLDAGLKVIDECLIQKGTADCVVAYPKEVLKYALNYNAISVVLYHNHPGGNASPSRNDIEITKEIQKVLASVNIQVQDHLIITKDDYYSFRDNYLL